MSKASFKALISKAKQRDSYWVQKAIHDFTEDLYCLMESRDVSKAELARRIDSSPAYVTKVLRGDTNFTIDSMVRLVRALDGQLSIHATRVENDVRWIEVVGPSETSAPAPHGNEFETVASHRFTEQAPLETMPHEPHPITA